MAGTIVVGTIESESNGDIDLAPNGTGVVEVRGNDNAGSIKLNCENNSHGVTIKSPAHTASATYTLTLPTSNGSDGEVLKTDGEGVLSWVAQPSAGASVSAENTWTKGQRGEITHVDISSGAIDIDFDDSNNFIVIVDEEIDDIDYSNLTEGQTGSIFFQYSGAHAVGGWDAATRWAGGTGGANNAPTFTATSGQVDRVDYIITRDQAAAGGNLRVQMVATLNYAD